MSYQIPGAASLDEMTCFYGNSRLPVRGPRRDLDTRYLACLGGAETFGRFVPAPFVELLERRLRRKAVNLGSLNCGLDAWLGDPDLVSIAKGADLCVLQLPCLHQLSNRFYRVHPRRNDRFLKASEGLSALYPEVDFTEFHFTGHLIMHLKASDMERFAAVQAELQRAWLSRMQGLISCLDTQVLLLRLQKIDEETGGDPAPISVEMLEQIAPHAQAALDITVRPAGQSMELGDMIFGTMQQPSAEHMLGAVTHQLIADKLARAIRDLD
ncbi:DUF6473 family protein [Ruegeria sp. 2205SS24-7]|uniref:DUF6473 family protein n=1 Tax=Ruegeria discodermiae TaxID=3064389 RepID=UPI0027415DAF|nr:DUF6473 family protein [Ruegeria sp. 2205SS24-7]MDP5219720.1 DUF6473 family protein [Ruegeria sp. 2205SS24-7]